MAIDISQWGTFKDSLKAPVFGWFTYPAGFSYKAVSYSLKEEGLTSKATVYDPFMGSGTTNLVAKMEGINSAGVEAHPFVYPIAKCKMNWDINEDEVYSNLSLMESLIKEKQASDEEVHEIIEREFPELILKCFLPATLYEILLIRNHIQALPDSNEKLFLRVALICTLRDVSIAATGWPYIAPNKIKITSLSKEGFATYRKRCVQMLNDLKEIKLSSSENKTEHLILLGDCRDTTEHIADESIDHIFTSPPYLNNFDYADRTRLEMYVMGDAKNWGDITSKVRTQLITSATTQIERSNPKYVFLESFKTDCPTEYVFLQDAVDQLTELRKHKGGKKSYDYLVLGYFNDMYQTLVDCYRVLKPNTTAKFILGDSAPYGVHIPTDELIGQIGKAIGFKDYNIDVLRTRGDKWKENPQRHTVPLRESIVTLRK